MSKAQVDLRRNSFAVLRMLIMLANVAAAELHILTILVVDSTAQIAGQCM